MSRCPDVISVLQRLDGRLDPLRDVLAELRVSDYHLSDKALTYHACSLLTCRITNYYFKPTYLSSDVLWEMQSSVSALLAGYCQSDIDRVEQAAEDVLMGSLTSAVNWGRGQALWFTKAAIPVHGTTLAIFKVENDHGQTPLRASQGQRP